MGDKFTIKEIKNYITSQDSLGDVLFNLSADNIRKANEEVKFERGDTVVVDWGDGEFLYDFGYYTDYGCVIYIDGERNMQDSYAVKLFQVRMATDEDINNLTWGR